MRFLNLLSELGQRSVVLLSTHIVEDVSELCTRMAIIQEGSILLEAEPLRAVEELNGRIWRRVVTTGELEALEQPDLRDVYFSVMAGQHGRDTPYLTCEANR